MPCLKDVINNILLSFPSAYRVSVSYRRLVTVTVRGELEWHCRVLFDTRDFKIPSQSNPSSTSAGVSVFLVSVVEVGKCRQSVTTLRNNLRRRFIIPSSWFAVFFTLATFFLIYPSFIHILFLSATFIPSLPSLSPILSFSLPLSLPPSRPPRR